MTRRKWTAGFSTALVAATAATALAQVTPPPATSKTPPEGVPAPAPVATTPEQKLQKAYADIRETSQRLAKIEVPMDVEPAFSFRP
jgi:hypothetical protein